jgi:hypothetical protein
VQVVPETQVPLPAQPVPPHCDHFGRLPPEPLVLVPVAVELAAVEPVAELPLTAVAVPPSKLITDVYAGFVVKFAFQRQASPCPENVDGIQEYLSV